MNYLSLFSGVGGFDLGFDRAGMTCAGQVEWDAAARSVLERHWPDVLRLNDVREVTGDEFGTVDLICGGFPCQDVSVAGKRAGLAGERSGLWFDFHRIINRAKPGWVVIENVPGLLSSNGGRDFAVIIRGLVECGYGVAWRVLDAQYFGVAQRRRRVFIVGSLGNGRSAQVLFEREGGARDIAEGRTAGAGTAQTVAIRAANTSSNGWGISVNGPSHTLDGASPHYVMAHGQANAEIVKDGSPSLTANHEAPIVAGTLGARGNRSHTEVDGHGAYVTTFQPRFVRNNRGAPGDIVPALTAEPGKTGKGDQANLIAGAAYGIRRLTPRECERLQGFPDDWTTGQSDSARYRQMGNAVAVPVAEWIGKRIISQSSPSV